jgi:hypothetical protein
MPSIRMRRRRRSSRRFLLTRFARARRETGALFFMQIGVGRGAWDGARSGDIPVAVCVARSAQLICFRASLPSASPKRCAAPQHEKWATGMENGRIYKERTSHGTPPCAFLRSRVVRLGDALENFLHESCRNALSAPGSANIPNLPFFSALWLRAHRGSGERLACSELRVVDHVCGRSRIFGKRWEK